MAFDERETTPGVDEAVAEEQDVLPEDPVLRRLFREGYLYEFFQAVWLLEQHMPDAPGPGETSDLSQERIRFRPHSGLSFPASDVRYVEWLDDERHRARMTVTFMGLYGVASPLPFYFYEALTRENEETEPLRDFLDVFNHRLYAFFYRAWKKYRPAFQVRRDQVSLHTQVFESLSGLGTPDVVQPPRLPLGRFVALGGLLANRVRNVEGLEQVASDVLDSLPVRICENVPRWVPLRSRPRMGEHGASGFGLGTNAVVGQRVRDISGKFRMVVGPMTLAQYRSFLPGGERARLLDYVVRLYAPDYLDYDVELRVRASDLPPLRLGGAQQMGRDMWLGRPEDDIVSVKVAYA